MVTGKPLPSFRVKGLGMPEQTRAYNPLALLVTGGHSGFDSQNTHWSR